MYTTIDTSDDRRGVSDVLAFTLSFAIIITSIGLVYTFGFSSLRGLQSSEQGQNAERAFAAFGTSMDTVEQGNAPSHAGELSLQGGSLTVDREATMEVVVDNQSGGTPHAKTFGMGTLRYSFEDQTFGYEGGAIFRSQGDANIMVEPPHMICEDDLVVMTVVILTSNEGTIGAGAGVQVTGIRDDYNVSYPSTRGQVSDVEDEVRIDISNTKYAEAWKRTLTEEGWTDNGGGQFTCDLGTSGGQVSVRTITIDVEFTT